MRRLEVFALVLACLLSLAACSGETGGQNAVPEPPPQDGGEHMTVYDCGGLSVALPTEHLDLLRVDTDFPDAEESWNPLISVYEKASYEAAMEDFGGGGGFLFGFLAMDQAAFEQHISSDGSGIEVFATDGERYYAYTHPTDVQFYRPDAGSIPDHPDWPVWEKLCEIGPQVREDFLTRNNLQSFSVQDFLDRPDSCGDHAVLKYYPYFLKDGDTRIYDQLLLRQPRIFYVRCLYLFRKWLSIHKYRSVPDLHRIARHCDHTFYIIVRLFISIREKDNNVIRLRVRHLINKAVHQNLSTPLQCTRHGLPHHTCAETDKIDQCKCNHQRNQDLCSPCQHLPDRRHIYFSLPSAKIQTTPSSSDHFSVSLSSPFPGFGVLFSVSCCFFRMFLSRSTLS